uniref:TNFR-Cys domain-containing protein n=1 Tax=Gadus morhua TaxID=8049 RepID=A0A8C5ACL8_GADMO
MVEAHTNGITMFLAFMLSICSVSFTCGVASTASPLCPKDEYRVGIECCPACPAGQQVYKDCEERIMTKCKDCSNGTFQEGFNVKKECSNCTKCDAGLKGKKLCSSKSDAVCEVLDGFFCIDSNGGGCRAAQSHTVCSPGYYIGQTGTADKDTECLPCANGTFSNGTSSCQPHTIINTEVIMFVVYSSINHKNGIITYSKNIIKGTLHLFALSFVSLETQSYF